MEIKSLSQEEEDSSKAKDGSTIGMTTNNVGKPLEEDKACSPCIKCKMPTIPDSLKNVFTTISYMGLLKALLSFGVFFYDIISTFS